MRSAASRGNWRRPVGTKAGELREMLITAIEDVKAGKLKAADAKAIAALAGQVNLSLQVELNVRVASAERRLDANRLGDLQLGHEQQPLPPGIVSIRQHRIEDDAA